MYTPIGYSRLSSTVSETYCNKKEKDSEPLHPLKNVETLPDKVMKKTTLVDLQKRFPKNHVYSKYVAAYHGGLASLQDLEKVGKTQVDW